jgi:predicted AAA+ superfamily ATPase
MCYMLSYARTLNISKLLKHKSFFLFGPRATGKTSLISAQLQDATVFDLLDAEIYNQLLRRPKILEEVVVSKSSPKIMVIDEVQKLPMLLDEVHRILSKHDVTFLLTGSSARKLRRGSANLLAGRAWQAELYPLCSREIPDFDLMNYLNKGGLPAIYGSNFAQEELRSYLGNYLKEEVQAESLTRNLPAFATFLDAIALTNGQEINFESLSSDCGVSPMTMKNYLSILDDTLIGFTLPAFTKTKKRKAISRGKYYLFDIGVVNQLARRGEVLPKSESFGHAFEHFIQLEIRAWNSYSRHYKPISYWRSTSKFEVDAIISDELAIEIKATDLVQDKHLKGLRALKEEGLIKEYCVVSCDLQKRVTDDGITIYPWRDFLTRLWGWKAG